MWARPSREEKKKTDNVNEMRRSKYKHTHTRKRVQAMREKWCRKNWGVFLREIRRTGVTVSTLVLPSTHEREYLNFIFSSATRLARSARVVLSDGEETTHFEPAVLSPRCTWTEMPKPQKIHLFKHHAVLFVRQPCGLDPTLGQIKC